METKFPSLVDAGVLLADCISKSTWYHKLGYPSILAIPNGGVPVGMACACSLGIPCKVAPAAKIKYRYSGKQGNGAVALDGSVYMDEALEALYSAYMLDRAAINRFTAYAREAVLRKREIFGLTSFDVGRNVIVVDDGAASGSTIIATVRVLKSLGVEQIIVALPTASSASLKRIESERVNVVCLDERNLKVFEVAGAYESWIEVSNEIAVAILNEKSLGTGMMKRLVNPK